MGRACNILVGKLVCKRPLGRRRCRWEDGFEMDVTKIWYDDMNWIRLAHDMDSYLLMGTRKLICTFNTSCEFLVISVTVSHSRSPLCLKHLTNFMNVRINFMSLFCISVHYSAFFCLYIHTLVIRVILNLRKREIWKFPTEINELSKIMNCSRMI
jgi:hypothetical protein